MKVRLILVVGLIVAALAACEGIRRQSGAGSKSLKMDEHSVLISGAAISGEDQEAVSKIFKKYDGSLYRIAVYENGKLKKKIGKMSEMQIGPIASEYSRNAEASGLTNWTTQIGNPTHITTAGNPTHITTAGNPTHITTGGSPTHVTTAEKATHVTSISPESDALVKEVTPILEKYSK